jgi:hypothetical protein
VRLRGDEPSTDATAGAGSTAAGKCAVRKRKLRHRSRGFCTPRVRTRAGSIPTARPKTASRRRTSPRPRRARTRSTTGNRASRRPIHAIAGRRLAPVSAGRFTQPPISASVQYSSLSGDDRSVWNNTMNLGFYSPFHPIPGISSGQYDLSYEQHFRGTDMSFKLTPFYTWVSNWQQQTFIGSNFATQVPVGVNRNQGVEFQFNKGDFTRNGSRDSWPSRTPIRRSCSRTCRSATGGTIPNPLTALNQVIAQYNALTKAAADFPATRQEMAFRAALEKIASGPRYHPEPVLQSAGAGAFNRAAGTTRTPRPSLRTSTAPSEATSRRSSRR